MSYSINYPYNTTSSTTYTINPITSNTAWATITSDGTSNLKPDSLEVKGNANFHGDLKIQGKSIKESLEKIEERLAILHPNKELEERWEELRNLRKQYMELEAEIKEKEKMWAILKK